MLYLTIKRVEQAKMEKQAESLRAIEDQILEIQVSEKHIPPMDQPVLRPLKPLDLDRIRVSEQAKAKALEDEEKAMQSVASANEASFMLCIPVGAAPLFAETEFFLSEQVILC